MLQKSIYIQESKVNYWIHNPHLRETILLIHGFRGNHKALIQFAKNFKEHRIILIDLPGYGASEAMKKKHTLKNYGQFLKLFIAELSLRDFTLFGHSYGGAICIQYAALQPAELQKLVLVSPAVSQDGFSSKLMAFYYKITNQLPASWRKSWLANATIDRIGGELLITNVSKKRKAELLKAGAKNLKELNPKVVVESFLSFLRTNAFSAARKMKVPTLIIAGAKDQIVPLARLQKLNHTISDSALVTIADQGHLSPLECPTHVATITKKFLN